MMTYTISSEQRTATDRKSRKSSRAVLKDSTVGRSVQDVAHMRYMRAMGL